jgi:hypothetical protein
MNRDASDVYNTTGQLQTLQTPPKPEWGSPDKGRELAARLRAVSERLHNNPMGKGTEEARALQAEGTLKTPLSSRHIDLLDVDSMYAGQLKSGPVSLTKENITAIAKGAELVRVAVM